MIFLCFWFNIQVNDLVRDVVRDKKSGHIPFVGEIISGACVSDILTFFSLHSDTFVYFFSASYFIFLN